MKPGEETQATSQFANQGSGPCKQSKRGRDDKAFPYRSKRNGDRSRGDGRAGCEALRKNQYHVVSVSPGSARHVGLLAISVHRQQPHTRVSSIFPTPGSKCPPRELTRTFAQITQ